MATRIPRHIGFIPDGNRRWAVARARQKEDGYRAGIEPGLRLLRQCREAGIHEVSAYGFTKENVRRPMAQVHAFQRACVEFAQCAMSAGAALRVIGDAQSSAFPVELQPYVEQRSAGTIRLNLLVNYGWRWDLFSGQRARGRRRCLARAMSRASIWSSAGAEGAGSRASCRRNAHTPTSTSSIRCGRIRRTPICQRRWRGINTRTSRWEVDARGGCHAHHTYRLAAAVPLAEPRLHLGDLR